MSRSVHISRRGSNDNLPLDQVDIREVLDELDIEYSEAGSNNVSTGWIGVTCPDPGCGDTTNHLGLCLSSPVISCFSCGLTGNYITYLSKELGSFNKAIEVLKKHIPRELRNLNEDDDEVVNTVTKVEVPEMASTKITQYHRKYLKKRGFKNWRELCDKHNFLFVGPVGKWSNRIIVPITRGNRLLTFTSVDIADETGMRYKHLSKELSIAHTKEYFLGLNHVKGRTVVVVEGFFDWLRIGDGCLCAFGAKVTEEQRRILMRFDRVIILFDGDEPGRKGATKLANELAPFTEVIKIDLDEGDDPDSMCEEDLQEIRNMLGRS